MYDIEKFDMNDIKFFSKIWRPNENNRMIGNQKYCTENIFRTKKIIFMNAVKR